MDFVSNLPQRIFESSTFQCGLLRTVVEERLVMNFDI